MDKQDTGYKITFDKFLEIFRKYIAVCIVISLLFGGVVFAATYFLEAPEYSSYTKIYVNSSGEEKSITQSDLTVAKSLVNTYIEILKTDTFLEKVAADAGVDYSPAKIRNLMTAASVSGTEIFKLTITDTAADTAFRIADAVVRNAPEEIKRVVECGKVTIIDSPHPAKAANARGLKRNTAIAVVAAFAVSFAVFFLREVLDITIYGEDELREHFKYPIIGVIPTIAEPKEDRHSRKKGRSGGNASKEGGNNE